RVEKLRLISNVEIILLVAGETVLASQDRLDFRLRFGNLVFRGCENRNRIEVRRSEYSVTRRCERNHDDVVGIVSKTSGLSLRFKYADDLELKSTNANVLTEHRFRSLK